MTLSIPASVSLKEMNIAIASIVEGGTPYLTLFEGGLNEVMHRSILQMGKVRLYH